MDTKKGTITNDRNVFRWIRRSIKQISKTCNDITYDLFQEPELPKRSQMDYLFGTSE